MYITLGDLGKEDALLAFAEAWPLLQGKLEQMHREIRQKQLHIGFDWKVWP